VLGALGFGLDSHFFVGGQIELVVEVVLLQELVVLLQGHTVERVPDGAGGDNCDGNLVAVDEILDTEGTALFDDDGFHCVSFEG